MPDYPEGYLTVRDTPDAKKFNGVPYIEDVPEGFKVYGVDHGWMGEWEPTDAERRYAYGQCHALALAILMERPEWELVSMNGGGHFAALAPDGVLDVEGISSADDGPADDEDDPWERLRVLVEEEDYALPVIDEVTRETAHNLIELCERR